MNTDSNSFYYIDSDDFQRLLNADISSVEKTKIFATFARINTLYMIAKAGSGHIGSSFSSMDIFSWMYLNELKEKDIFFSSKGHDAPGLYAVLIGIGKLPHDNLHRLRRLHGLPGHPDIRTPEIITNTGSLGMGVSKAKGMIISNRIDNIKSHVYVLTGDGEFQEGQLWESLSGAVNECFDELTIIIDHNKIQSDTWVSQVSDLGDLEAKLASFGLHVERCDGNNLNDFERALAAIKAVKGKPKVIIADTVKGCGVSFMEATSMSKKEELYSFHSGAPSPEDYRKAAHELIENANELLVKAGLVPLTPKKTTRQKVFAPLKNMQKLIPAYEKVLLETGGRHKNLVVLDADLMVDCGLLSFHDTYPERFIECGIAEQDMVSMAGAMALKGKIPVVHSFSCFLAARANEQIFNNASERTKCIYIGSLAGVLPSGPGHSHQMVRDISAIGGIPGLLVIEPSCEEEVKMAFNYAIEKSSRSTYIRLISIPYEVSFSLPDDYSLQEGKGVTLMQGNDAVLFSYGPVILSEACKAASILKGDYGISLKVVNLPWLNKIDNNWLINTVGKIKKIFSYENHFINGGQGEKLATALLEIGKKIDIEFHRMGLKDFPMCGSNDEILDYYGFNAQSIIKNILSNID